MNTSTIMVNGKEYSLLFAYTCYKLFMTGLYQHRNAFFPEEGGITSEGAIHLIHSAYINYCLDKNVKEELSFDDLYEAVDEMTKTEEGLKLIGIYYEMFLKSKPVLKLTKEAEKKNQIMEEPLISIV